MHQTLVLESVQHNSPSLGEDLENAFDDETTGDVKFVSNSENKCIHVHKSILEIRSQCFRTMFTGEWKESLEKSCQTNSSISFTSFHALLYFLYTDKIEFPHDDFENIIALLKLADFYLETRLSKACELLLKQNITIQNAVELFSAASKYNVKELQDFSFQFILKNREQIPFDEHLANFDLEYDDLFGLQNGFNGLGKYRIYNYNL